jgi:very-short-patch-repair endonuclease
LKFRRQQPFGPSLLDFFSAAHQVAVEADGGQHFAASGEEADTQRTAYLVERGLTVLRFSNLHVLTRLAGVISEIVLAVPTGENCASGG